MLLASAVLDVLTGIYIIVTRPFARYVYGAALVVVLASILFVTPGEFFGFVAAEIGTDALTWFIRLSFMFVIVAPFIKPSRRRPGG